jgi:hypothetical protein
MLAIRSSLAGTVTTNTSSPFHAIKSTDSYYFLHVHGQNRGNIFSSADATSGYTDTDYPFGSALLQYVRHLVPSNRDGALAVTLDRVGTNNGTNFQIMEYSGLAGTWGTSLITAGNSRCGQSLQDSTNRYNQLGPWNGRVIIAATRTYSGNGGIPDANLWPIYDGTTWSYIPMVFDTSGTDWREKFLTYTGHFIGCEDSRYSWYWGYRYTGGYGTYDTSYTLARYDEDAASWTYSDGTALYGQFVTTGGGGLLSCSVGNLNKQFNNGYDGHVWHLIDGTKNEVGTTFFQSSTGVMHMIYAGGDWTGGKLGDVYLVPQSNPICMSYGAQLIYGIAVCKNQGGTAFGTWEQYGSPQWTAALQQSVGLF